MTVTTGRASTDHATEQTPLLHHDNEQRLHTSSPSRRQYGAALALLILLSTGANWAEACLGPLKHLLVKSMDINNTQFGVISASTQLANTLFPLFVVWIDDVSAADSRASKSRLARTTVYATAIVCLGTAATALGAHSAHFPLLVSGRIVQGLGVILVDTVATKLLVRWFRSSGGLSFAISLNFACDRAAATVSKAIAVPVARSFSHKVAPHPARTFWLAVCVSGISLLAAVGYLLLLEPSEPMQDRENVEGRNSEPVGPRAIDRCLSTIRLASQALLRTFQTLPSFFVFLAVTQFYQPIAVFNTLAADVVRWKGASPEKAGYLASVGQALPIVIAPLLGAFFDRFGHRMEFVPVTAVLLATCFGLLLWSHLDPIFAMLIFSLGNAINSPPYLCSLAILLRHDATFGCAWGVWKALMQSYQIIMNTTLGRLQDITPGQGYERVLTLLFLTKVAEFAFGIAYVVLDRTFMRGILASNDSKRRQIESSLDADGQAIADGPPVPPTKRLAGLHSSRISSITAMAYFSIVVFCAWTLFFTSYWIR